MSIVTLSSKGQIVIPARLRKKLGLKQTARLRVQLRGGRIVLEPEASGSWESLEGSIKTTRSLTKCLEEEHKREVDREQPSLPYVFDSWAIIAWLTGEQPAAAVVRKALKEAYAKSRAAAMCLINLGEVYYIIGRESGVRDAEQARRRLLEEAPIRFEPARQDLVFRAAKLKMKYSFSYADAFAAALALKLKGYLLTGDPEMHELEAAEGLKIKWLTREGG